MRNKWLTLVVAVLAPTLLADVTLRYNTEIQTPPLLGAAVASQALDNMRDMAVRVKGNQAYSTQGNLTSIMNLTTQDLTLVDTAHKRFATVSAGQYAQQVKAAMPAVSAQASAALASMKTNFASRSTGRTATIQGISAEEQEFVLTMEMPLPGGPQPGAPLMKMVMQMWSAKPAEVQRVPGLQEIKNYMSAASSVMNPTDAIKQILSGLPGMGENLSAMLDKLSKNGAISLRTHTELFMPFMAVMSQQLPGQPLPGGLDPNAPFMQMNQEVVELSTDPLDDSLFQVPEDYQAASLEEILKGAVTPPAAPQFKQ